VSQVTTCLGDWTFKKKKYIYRILIENNTF
jgi:hypothetical protein